MDSNIKKRASHRSKIIEGQFRALQKAIENEDYCVDILTQSLAIEKSLRSLNKLVLENHMRTHVITDRQNDGTEDKERLIAEMLRLYELGNVRG